MDKLVSILIPVYNRENIIQETIQSALNQTYNNIEIIVVDNHSTDNTWEILKKLSLKDKRIKIFQNETNLGPVRNWVKCLEYATGEYGKFLWSDDLISPQFLEKTIPFLNDDDVGFVFTGTEIFIDGTDEKNLAYFIGETGIYKTEKYIRGVLFGMDFPVSPGCALFRLKDLRKNLLLNIPNKIDSDFSMHAIGNDLLIYLLTANQYRKFAFVNEKLSFFRAHSDSISIRTDIGKLILLYDLAKAYFVENYRKDLIKKLNAIITIHVKMYRRSAKEIGLDRIEKFYLNNNDYEVDYSFLCRFLCSKLLYKLSKKLTF